uniref:Uncharacterized protein n=1 Tax=Arundo donax TaxID=35708 RepID=A0A0A9F9N7_ARUDO
MFTLYYKDRLKSKVLQKFRFSCYRFSTVFLQPQLRELI